MGSLGAFNRSQNSYEMDLCTLHDNSMKMTVELFHLYCKCRKCQEGSFWLQDVCVPNAFFNMP